MAINTGKSGRSYSDPSYGSKKLFRFSRVTAGTRASVAVVTDAGMLTVMHPITITGFGLQLSATGEGTSFWYPVRNVSLGLCTLGFASGAAILAATRCTISPAVTGATCAAGDVINLWSGANSSSTLAFVEATVEYIERFDSSDN
jgi:hypothetical protein